MEIIPGILGEAEFAYFNENDYGNLRGVLNTALAGHLKSYLNTPNANPKVVADINKYLGDEIVGLTMHKVMQEKGITDMVTSLSPETLLTVIEEKPEIREQLTYLAENFDKLRVTIKPATKADYERFESSVLSVLQRMSADGIVPTFPDIRLRLDANKFIFYKSNGKLQSTGVGILNAKHQQWRLCLNGLLFKEYCDEKNINYVARRVF